MKKIKIFKSGFGEKLKLLLIPIGLLIGSLTSQVWAWSPVYLNGDFTGGNWGDNGNGSETYQVNYELDGSNSGHYFLPFYTSSGDKYWRFYEVKAWNDKYLNCPATDNEVMNVGTAAYQIEGGHKNNFKSTVDAGIIAVHIHQNYDGKGKSANGSNDRPRVWLERPTIYIWHNWNNNTANWNNNGGSGQKAMTDNQDGTYTYDGLFAGTSSEQNKTNVGIEGSAAIKKYFGPGAPTLVGSPTTGDKCRFTWNSNGYLGYDGETTNRGSLTITKILTITYHGNGNEGGSAPSNEEVLYNTATATYTNTGNMTKTNYAFIGWNTQADGRGTHYDAGANITLTTDKDLYAEWVPCWVLRGGNSGSSDGSDAMGDWTPQEMTIIGTNAFMIELTLAANTTYYFKVADRHNGKKADYSTYTHYGNSGTMNGTTLDWNFETSKGNCTLKTGASGGGIWRFAWNASSKYLCVYAPADAPKSSFAQGKYIYFDARANSTWKSSEFKAKFWFKNLASGADDGDISCLHTAALDDWVYYALVPANKTWGSVQMNSRNASTDAFNYDANTIYARGRSNENQNSMVVPSSGGSGVTLSWGTYCPPMSASTLEDNGTTLSWGGNGSSASPYLIPTSSDIKVSAGSTSALPDDNMTAYYLFKYNSVAQGSGSSTNTKTITASGTSGNKFPVIVESYNYYNSTEGTHLASSAIYYETRTPYTISYNKGTNGTGTRDSETKLKDVNFTLPNSAVFTRTGYTQTGWTTSDGGDETHALGGSYTGNSDQAFYPAWTANEITVTLDKGEHGTADQEMKINYDATGYTSFTRVAATGYNVDGYYYDALKVLNADGSFAATNVSGFITDGKWTKADDCILTAHFTIKTYNGTIDATGGTADGSYSVTYLDKQIVVAVGDEPIKAGYHVSEYFLDEDCKKSLADKDGNLYDGVSISTTQYTSDDNEWMYDGNPKLYVTWAANTITINLNDNKGGDSSGDAGSTKRTVTMGDNDYSSITFPTRTGYTCTGYYLAADGDDQVFNNEGSPAYSVTGHTDALGNWIQASTVTLYAHWEAKKYEITLNDRGATTASTTSTTLKATYDSDALTATITNPVKWGNVFGGWVANSDGTGDVIIDTDGKLVEDEVDGYIDEDGKWIHDGDVNLYAKWTPEDHLYWIPGNTSSQVGNVSGAVEFISAGGGKYYVKIDTDNNQLFHLGDGTNAAGPASPTNTDHTEFTLATSACGLSTNSYWFKQTGSKQTIVYVLDINTLQLSFENLVIYKPGDKSGDGHTAYGSVEGFSGTIYGTFEYRMRVDEIGKWNTLYLPFTTTNVQVWDGAYYSIYPCHRSEGTLKQGYYVIRTPESATNFPIKDFGKWNDPTYYTAWVPAANTPYIIQWQMDYFHNKYISFWGNGTTIASSVSFEPEAAPDDDDVVNVLGNGTLGTVEVTAAYVLANDYGSGAWLRDEDVKKKSEVGPFECYILANAKTTGSHLVIKRRTDEEVPTGWEDVLNSENKAQIVVYTITGLRVTEYNDCSFNEAGRRLSETYNEGIFIMRAGDESVKLMLK